MPTKQKLNLTTLKNSSLIIISALWVTSCSQTVVVDNCPIWLEPATVSLDDSVITKRWVATYETNRRRECD